METVNSGPASMTFKIQQKQQKTGQRASIKHMVSSEKVIFSCAVVSFEKLEKINGYDENICIKTRKVYTRKRGIQKVENPRVRTKVKSAYTFTWHSQSLVKS